MRFTLLSSLVSCSLACAPPEENKKAPKVFLPDVEDAVFVSGVDNPFFPLPVGATWTLSEGDETIEIEVLAETRTVNGVEAVVVKDTAYQGGEIIEDTDDWFAQDEDGNVWYLGEETCEYQAGECASTEGSWEWGVDGALPGIQMWAEPEVDGRLYYQEYYPEHAEDVGEVVELDVDVTVPAGSYTGCVRTHDTSMIEELDEYKHYCPGVGMVLETDGDGAVSAEATVVSIPDV